MYIQTWDKKVGSSSEVEDADKAPPLLVKPLPFMWPAGNITGNCAPYPNLPLIFFGLLVKGFCCCCCCPCSSSGSCCFFRGLGFGATGGGVGFSLGVGSVATGDLKQAEYR